MDFLFNYYTTYILMIIAMLFSLYASFNVNSTFKKYSKIYSSRGQTAAQIARQILDSNGLYDISVVHVNGNLTDHYDPKRKIIALSSTVHDSTSVGAIGVAAHEVGHAIQYAKGYIPIKIRMTILPVAQLGSHLWLWIFLLGILFSMPVLRNAGIILFAAIVLFQLITLPVEFNASSRAIKTIEAQGILYGDEIKGARKTLTAAAMTYVAALAVSITQLLRLLTATRRR
ncbi:MAG: zinc metallopeptidase [Ruminiclostridium sp.]|nr:zinc metallopeptidase [Ruminiclostridium sp.]